jgi:hypothetical protein
MADKRRTPRRLKVMPPPGGRRPSDWLGQEIETAVPLRMGCVEIPAGTPATILCGSHGGSGMTIRLATGHRCGGITHEHIRRTEPQEGEQFGHPDA